MDNNNWRIKQQSGIEFVSDRSKRREWNRNFSNFIKTRIKDKFWWISLTDGERKSVYSAMTRPDLDGNYMIEKDAKKLFPGNISMKRDLILDEITK
jgi:hypothetical protein